MAPGQDYSTGEFFIASYTHTRTAAPPAPKNGELLTFKTHTHQLVNAPAGPINSTRQGNPYPVIAQPINNIDSPNPGMASSTTVPARPESASIKQTRPGNPYPVIALSTNNIDSPNPDMASSTIVPARPESASSAFPTGASSVATTPVTSREDRVKRKRSLSELNEYENAKKARQFEDREEWEVAAPEELFLPTYAPWLCDEPLIPYATTESYHVNTLALPLPTAAPQLDDGWSPKTESYYSQEETTDWSLDGSLEEGHQVERERNEGAREQHDLPEHEPQLDAETQALIDATLSTLEVDVDDSLPFHYSDDLELLDAFLSSTN